MYKSAVSVVALAAVASAQVPVWQQCGGINHTGSTVCTTSATCTSLNDWYYQCVPATSSTVRTTSTRPPVITTTSSVPTTITSSVRTSSTTSSSPSSSTSVRTTTGVTSFVTTTTSPTTTASPPPEECVLLMPRKRSKSPPQPATRYLITFGDSYSQTGFDINGQRPSAANPLGNPPLPGWTASGGLDWVGFMVTEFNRSLTLSYNFAYGGATTDASLVTPYDPSVRSFVDQIGQFNSSIATHPSYAPWTAANTLAGVWMGVNDVGNTFWLEGQPARIGAIMDVYFSQLQVLYNAGVRNFVLLTVPPTYLTPLFLAEDPTSLSASIDLYNDAIASRLATFRSANRGVTATIVDTSVPFLEAIENPTEYGAPDAVCENEDGESCLWFNNYHPGVQIQRLVAAAVARSWSGFFRPA
ncbi:hypothetical protein S7711_02472 [Stachybotrys chartarum IBT 7711]|uniref:CBM1 domain-containing protein n=1 Tax=Stachybotrys chartarum (strain CBS 109288 / IBT 7711) TaxID=1280523 RepID=A0A084B552_STACB|nr:hypothetical protein S7711_02472 [Stachybotrys chartarum IBT 7711]KFA48207.1 hypothetical protein S40293_07420 [Stachybotrys chartarum IBT 40293]KFA79763.1 hypothetical protein S40288_00720 [Stachybotrys chartarum IBT 40288]